METRLTSEKQALIIIDMQKGSFVPETPRNNSSTVIEKINALAETMRKNQCPVIFIQHDGSKENEYIPGTESWEILNEIEIRDTDLIVSKTANDAFYQTDLQSILSRHEVNELIITGCATDFCVEATIQSALTKDYKIIVLEDGHTTGDRPHMSSERVIQHYNWIWRNMIPIRGRISVVDFASFKDRLIQL